MAPGVITYETDWSQRDRPGGGLSQRITLMSELGTVVRTVAIEAGVDTRRIDNLPLGNYRLRAELFSQPAQSGARVGTLEMPFVVTPTSAVSVAVGANVATVHVVPASIQVAVPRGARCFAVVKSATGKVTFAPEGALAWSVSTPIGTINAEGAFQATAAGQGTLRATYTPTGASQTIPVIATAPQTSTTPWTVLVYMSAASDLYPFSDLNFNQLERVAGNSDVRFIVQWKQSRANYPQSSFDGTRRYRVVPDQGNAVASDLIQDLGGGVDMGRWQSLREFVSWGKTYYPGSRTVLVIWGHGNGWRRKPDQPLTRAVAYDDQTRSAIQVWELRQALSGLDVDILAWDASLMQMLEVAYEVRGVADYIVGSEESPPAEGYPYDAVFGRFRDQPNASTRDLTKAFVDAMIGAPIYQNRKITQSVLESTKLDALERAVDALAVELRANNAALESVIPAVRASAQAYTPQASPPRYYRDLYDVCLKLEAATQIASVRAAAALVRQRISEAVVWEGHNAGSPGSHGVSIDLTPGSAFTNSANDYFQLEFGQRNRWDEWLQVAP